MTGLIKKDFYIIRQNLVSMFFVVLVFGMVWLNSGSGISMIVMCTFMGSAMILNSAAYDAQAKWDLYVLSMPVSRKDVVISRYCVMLIEIAVAVGLSSCLVALFSKPGDEIEGILLPIMVECFSVAVLYGSLMMLVLSKIGVEKTRIVLIALYMIPTILIVGAINITAAPKGLKDAAWQQAVSNAAIPMLAVSVAALAVSMMISIKIYEKKEF